jgi:transposase
VSALFCSLPDHPAKRIHELLPWNWRCQSIAAEAA